MNQLISKYKNMSIEFKITFKGSEDNLKTLAEENGWTGTKRIVADDGSVTEEEETVDQFICSIVVSEGIFPLIARTTNSLELKNGTLNYNAGEMSHAMKSLISMERMV